MPQTLTPTNDWRHVAAGNLAYLLSIILNGQKLIAEEVSSIRKVITDLELDYSAGTWVDQIEGLKKDLAITERQYELSREQVKLLRARNEELKLEARRY